MAFTVTQAAGEAIRSLLESEQLPETGGMRIALAPDGQDEPELDLRLVPGGGVDDEEIRAHGARVFLDPGVVDALAGKVLDAEPHGDHVHFAFVERDE